MTVTSVFFEAENIINPFPNTPFWDCPKFKAADDNWNVAIKEF